MEEEGGDDSEMIDAMEGWDSDQDDQKNDLEKDKTGSDKAKKMVAAAGEAKGVDAS